MGELQNCVRSKTCYWKKWFVQILRKTAELLQPCGKVELPSWAKVPDIACRGASFAMLSKGRCRTNASLLIFLVIQGSFVQCLEETRGSADRVCCYSSCDVGESSQNEQHMFSFTEVQQNSVPSTQNIWEWTFWDELLNPDLCPEWKIKTGRNHPLWTV